MNLKIKVKGFLVFLICILFVFTQSIIGTLPIGKLGDIGNWRVLTLVFSIAILIMYICNKYRFYERTVYYCKVYPLYISILIIALLILLVFSCKEYNQSILDVIIAQQGQMYIFIMPAVLFILDDEQGKGFYKLMEALNVSLIIFILIYVLLNSIYEIVGINIASVSTRYGHLRFDPPSFAGIVVLYDIWQLMRTKKQKYKVCILMYFAYMFLMSGTRMEMIALSIAAGIEILLFRRKFHKQVLVVFFIGIVLAIATAQGIFDSIIGSFSETSDLALSTSIRIAALEYFKYFQESHPLVGMGYIRAGIEPSRDAILYGPFGKYIFSDTGLLGFFYKTGWFSLVLIGIPLFRIIHLAIKNIKNMKYQYASYMAGIVCYILICQISLAITDLWRAMLLPLVWGIIEWLTRKGTILEINEI